MSWFLPSTRRKGGKRKSKPARKWADRSGGDEPAPGRWRRRAKVMAIVLAVGGLTAGAWLGYGPLREQVAGRRTAAAREQAPRVHLRELPAWMRRGEARRIAGRVAELAGDNPLDRQALADAADYLQAEAWVKRVNHVRRRADGTIEVHADWRQPVALVGARDGYHLISASGVRLPGVYDHSQLADLGLTAITGVQAAPPLQGRAWPGEDVQAGLKMVKLLAGQRFGDQVRGVDVTNYAGRADADYPHISLVTAEGMVRWGRAPGEAGIYEPNVPEKLDMLRRVAARYDGRIDAGGQTVDVYLDTPLIHPSGRARYTSSR